MSVFNEDLELQRQHALEMLTNADHFIVLAINDPEESTVPGQHTVAGQFGQVSFTTLFGAIRMLEYFFEKNPQVPEQVNKLRQQRKNGN